MASTAAMRPLMVADPMLRAPRPEIVSASTTGGAVARSAPAGGGAAGAAAACVDAGFADGGVGVTTDPGIAPFSNSLSSIGTLASMVLKANCVFCWLPFGPTSMEYGRYHPFTGL